MKVITDILQLPEEQLNKILAELGQTKEEYIASMAMIEDIAAATKDAGKDLPEFKPGDPGPSVSGPDDDPDDYPPVSDWAKYQG